MSRWFNILILTAFAILQTTVAGAQEKGKDREVSLVPMCMYDGELIPYIRLREVYIFAPLVFKNEKQLQEYNKLVRDVKKTLPLSKEVYKVVIETYEYLQTLPDEKTRKDHIKRVEKGVKEQYTPQVKKLTFSQGKLLIKLVDRQCHQTSYDLVKAFIGPFRAGFYQTFAGLFGASLKKRYDPQGADKMVERIVLLVENGQL